MPLHGQGSVKYHVQVTAKGEQQLLHGRNTCSSSNAQKTIDKDCNEKKECLHQGCSGVLGTFYA